MDKNEPFFPQSPQSSQTWPMDKIGQSRFQQKMSSLSSSSPVTPKRNYSISNSKSLLLQCLRDANSDPLPRRRFSASYSDEGVLMDGVLVTSASGNKDSPTSLTSLGRSPRSSAVQIQHKNTAFSSPRSQSGRNQNPPGYALSPSYQTHQQAPSPYHHPSWSPRSTGHHIPHDLSPSPTRISLPTTPFSSHPNANTRKPPLHTPISTNPAPNLSTTNGSRLGLTPSVDGGLDVVTPKELGPVMQKPDLSSPPAGLETVATKNDWSPSDDGLPTLTQAQADFVKSQDRVLPDDVFEHYKHRKRLPIFTQLCLDDKEGCDNTT